MECLIIGINYIYRVELLKVSAGGNYSRKNQQLPVGKMELCFLKMGMN
jgi:hypothetical protein